MSRRIETARRFLFPLLGAALIGLAALPAPGSAQGKKKERGKVIAVAAARIETIADGSIRDGVIIIRNGKIAEVGRALPIPEGAEVIDAGEGTVIPGLVVPVSRIGLSPASRGSNRTPHYRTLDELDAYRETYERLLAGGVTTVNLVPGGGGVMGQSVAIRARRGARDDVTLKSPTALLMSIEPSSQAKSNILAELDRGKKAIEEEKKKEAEEKKKREAAKGKAEEKPEPEKKEEKEKPKPDPKLQPLIDVLEGRLPILIQCQTPAAAAHLFPVLEPYRKDPFKTRAALIAGPEIYRAREIVKREKVPVILRAAITFERYTSNRICVPQILASDGVEVALVPASDSEEGVLDYLLTAAQMIKHGMRRDDVLEAMTLTPARILGIDTRVGSIEPGKDADLVILDGDPFHGTTRIEKVLLQGRLVHRFGERPDTSGMPRLVTTEKGEGKTATKAPPGRKPKGEKTAKGKGKERGKKEPPIAIVGADILTVSGGVIRGGTIVVREGKIDEVGTDLPVPKGASVIDGKGLYACPGFVAADSRGLGISYHGAGGSLKDALDPYAFSVELALAAGITTAFVPGPSRGSSDLIGGTNALIKMTEGDLDRMLIREPAAIPIRYSGASAAAKYDLKERLRKAVEYGRKVEEARAKGKAGKPPPRDAASEALLPLIRGDLPARISAGVADDLLSTLELADEFGIRLVLDGAHEAWTVAEEISMRDVSLVIAPRRKVHADRTRKRGTGSNIRLPSILRKAGVPFSILPPQSILQTGGIVGQDLGTLPVDAAIAVGRGLDEATALEAITLTPARALGIADRIGSIEPGKDADIILLDGHPLDFRSFVTLTMINGKVYYEKNEHALFAPYGKRPAKKEQPSPSTP